MTEHAQTAGAAPCLRTARLAVRRHARRLLHVPGDPNAHMARLQSALELPGAEPVQGALADLFSSFGASHVALKHTALQLAKGRLSAHAARWFEAKLDQAPLPAINPLATRWSVLAHPLAGISTRARRCSTDDSRLLAGQAVLAFEAGDQTAQNEFLHHCVTCHDNLAFMLARRALRKSGTALPDDWEAVSLQLEHPRETT
ncbi:hypothetical protein [Polaromonas sp. DSR2-3-2]|uniref:hypothetical protein n=1 Tax=unclassified Polaromonas TaxID=2638319 RepID=UPI003CE7D039